MSQLDDILRNIKPYVLGWFKDAQAQVVQSGTAVAEGSGIDVVLNRIGLGGDTILVMHSNGRPVDEFPATDAGLDLAGAAAEAGACVILVPGAAGLNAAHTLAGCVYFFPVGLIVGGSLTTVNGTRIYGLRLEPAGNSPAAVVGVLGPAIGEAHLHGCVIAPTNSGTGGVHAVEVAGSGTLYCHDCKLDGRSAAIGSSGYAGFRAFGATGDLYVIDGGMALGSDAANPFNE